MSKRDRPSVRDYVLVPREPTEAMLQTAWTTERPNNPNHQCLAMWLNEDASDEAMAAIYRAMLAVALQPAGRPTREEVETILADAFNAYEDARYPSKRSEIVISARDAILALFHPAETSGWRPIETAPRDGTPILYWEPKCVFAETVCFLNGSKIVEAGWYPYTGGNWHIAHDSQHPKAVWMPLPAPPEGQG